MFHCYLAFILDDQVFFSNTFSLAWQWLHGHSIRLQTSLKSPSFHPCIFLPGHLFVFLPVIPGGLVWCWTVFFFQHSPSPFAGPWIPCTSNSAPISECLSATASLQLMANASMTGWCGIFFPHKVEGTWPQEFAHQSSKSLNLWVLLSHRHFAKF